MAEFDKLRKQADDAQAERRLTRSRTVPTDYLSLFVPVSVSV